jgi:hypothetical protein
MWHIHRIHAGGEKGLTVGGLCEAVAGLKFNPGEHVYLENIDIQVRRGGDRVEFPEPLGFQFKFIWIQPLKKYCGA